MIESKTPPCLKCTAYHFGPCAPLFDPDAVSGTLTLSSSPPQAETREQARERGAQTASSSDVVHVPGTTGDELRWYKLGCEDGAEHEATHWKAQLEQVTAERDDWKRWKEEGEAKQAALVKAARRTEALLERACQMGESPSRRTVMAAVGPLYRALADLETP